MNKKRKTVPAGGNTGEEGRLYQLEGPTIELVRQVINYLETQHSTPEKMATHENLTSVDGDEDQVIGYHGQRAHKYPGTQPEKSLGV